VAPQALDEEYVSQVICEMLRQEYYFSRIHIQTNNSYEALSKFMELTGFHRSKR
jgi:hypothetical protein